jgi:DedD protein
MMERALKERIIGAVILVIFVVLVVPIFLDGPPAESDTFSELVLLPGQEDQDTKTVVLDRKRSNPMPIVSSSKVDVVKSVVTDSGPNITSSSNSIIEQRDEKVSVAPKATEVRPEQQVSSAKLTQSTTGMWTVQLGSFSNKQSAEKLYRQLRKQGYAAFLSQFQSDSGQLHRVRIGPQKNRQSAEAMAVRLLKVGYTGEVLPHP